MCLQRRDLALAVALTSIVLGCAGCGYIAPALQSPVDTPIPTSTPFPTWTLVPTGTPEPSVTQTLPPATRPGIAPTEAETLPAPVDTATPTMIPTITQTPTPGPSPTPDMRATSDAVFATITALAATPTYPPTSTPRPRHTPFPIGAGPGDDIPPTALFSSGEIAVRSLSQQVYPGGAAALTVKTRPAALCSLLIARAGGSTTRLEPISGTATRAAGQDGVVAWIWTIASDEPIGIMSLVVDCGAAGKAQLQIRIVE